MRCGNGSACPALCCVMGKLNNFESVKEESYTIIQPIGKGYCRTRSSQRNKGKLQFENSDVGNGRATGNGETVVGKRRTRGESTAHVVPRHAKNMTYESISDGEEND